MGERLLVRVISIDPFGVAIVATSCWPAGAAGGWLFGQPAGMPAAADPPGPVDAPPVGPVEGAEPPPKPPGRRTRTRATIATAAMPIHATGRLSHGVVAAAPRRVAGPAPMRPRTRPVAGPPTRLDVPPAATMAASYARRRPGSVSQWRA